MLDENLPTFHLKQSTDTPLKSAVYFSQNGSEPAPEYLFERAHPSINPAAARKYAVALKDPFAQDVVYAEVVVTPEWQQPSLSAAELRQAAQQQPIQPTPLIPDTFTIQLYDPDQAIMVRYLPGSLTKTDTWEFEMLSQSFKMPTPSQLDRQVADESSSGPRADFRPRIMFKWKRDSRLSKDMTCYNVGKSLGKHKSKEPDITVALFKMARESAVTVYEPNLQRVEMEDRKGLDIVLVIGAEVIRDLYLAPEKRPDLFNMGAGAPMPMANGKRKNSKPLTPPTTGPATVSGAMARPPPQPQNQNNIRYPRKQSAPPAMSGALGGVGGPPPPAAAPFTAANNNNHTTLGPGGRRQQAVDAETERLRKMVDEENRRAAAERERRDREEAKRIERMLQDEEKANRRQQAEVDRETERLKKLYGTQGQQLPQPAPQQQHSSPALPPRRQQQPPPHQQQQPPRPLSVGPGSMGPWTSSTLGSLFSRPAAAPPSAAAAPQSRPTNNNYNNNHGGRPSQGTSNGPYMSGTNPMAAVSGFLQNVLDPSKKSKITKKRSMQW